MDVKSRSLQNVWRFWLSLLTHVWLTIVIAGGSYLLWMVRSESPQVMVAHHVFSLLKILVVVVVPVAVQTFAAAVIIQVTGASSVGARVLIGVVTAGVGAMLYSAPAFSLANFAVITICSGIGVGVQSITMLKPVAPGLRFPAAYFLAIGLIHLVSMLG